MGPEEAESLRSWLPFKRLAYLDRVYWSAPCCPAPITMTKCLKETM